MSNGDESRASFRALIAQLATSQEWEADAVFWVRTGSVGAFWFTPSSAKNLRRWWVPHLARRYDLWHVFPHSFQYARYVLQESRMADAGREERAADVVIAPVYFQTICNRLAADLLAVDDPQRALEQSRNRRPSPRVAAPPPSPPNPETQIPTWVNEHFKGKMYTILRLLWGKGEVAKVKVWEQMYGMAPFKDDTLHSLITRTNKRLVGLPVDTTATTYEIRTRRGEVLILLAAE